MVAAAGGGGQIRQGSTPKYPISPCGRPAQFSHPRPGVTAPRIIVPGATTAITRRTTLRKAFLAPWHPGVEQAWLYSLALAQRHTGVAVHHATRVITHNHLTVTPERDNLPCFTRMFHHELSCALNTLLARQRYDQPGELFDGRAHMMRLCADAAQSTQLIYEHLNPVAAGAAIQASSPRPRDSGPRARRCPSDGALPRTDPSSGIPPVPASCAIGFEPV